MAERRISTRVAIEGENEYRSAISSINRELKTLASELKLVESQYKSEANTLAALEAKGKALSDMFAKQGEKVKEATAGLKNASEAQSKHAAKSEELRTKLAGASAELEKLKNSSGDTAKEQEKLTAQIAKLSAELKESEAKEQAAAAGVQKWTLDLNSAQIGLNDLSAAVDKNNKYLDEANKSTDKCAKSIDQYGKEVKGASEESGRFGKVSSEAIESLAAALSAAGVTAALKEIAAALWECVDASIVFESSMAGVAKTTNLTDAELAEMSDQIKALTLEIPITAKELAKIVEVAGQLGIAKENLVQFAVVMADLGVATNMTSEEAATMLAQFTAITGMDVSNFENLGSAIVALGNNFATNEQKITDMSQAIAAAGTNAGMSEADMLALSTAVTSVGITAQNGGTQMAKLVNEMKAAVETGNGLNDWAAAAGMSAQEFSTLWGRDATAALGAFIGNLNNLDSSATVTLSTLGITEQRMVTMITSLANAEDKTGLLTRALDISNTAWRENNALQREAQMRYETTESKIQLYKNSVENLKIAIGDELTPALGKLAETGQNINEWLTEVIENIPALVPIITALIAALAVFVVGVTAVTVASTAAAKAIIAMTVAMATNPIFLAITAVVALGAAVYALVAQAEQGEYSLKKLTEAARDLPDALDAADESFKATETSILASAATAEQLVTRLEELQAQYGETASSQGEYRAVLQALADTVPELTNDIDLQNGVLMVSTAEIRENIAAWKDHALAQAGQEKYNEVYAAYSSVIYEVSENEVKLAKAQAEHAAAERKLNDASERRNELYAEGQKAADEYYKETGVWIESTVEYSEEYINLTDAMADAVCEMSDAEDKVKKLSKAVDEGNETLVEYEEQVAAVDEVMRYMADGTLISAETVGEAGMAIIETCESLEAEMESLQAAYDTAYQAAYESISNTCGLFETLDGTAKQTVDDLIASLDSQIVFMNEYAANIARAMEMGVDEGIIAKLSDGSEESAQILAAIVAGGEKKVAELNAKLGQVEEGKEVFSTTVADMQTDYTAKADEIQRKTDEMVENFNQETSAYNGGVATVQGYINGLNSKLGELQAVAAQIASTVTNAMNTTYRFGSPSKVMIARGEETVEGNIIGLKNKEDDLKQESDKIARITLESLDVEARVLAAEPSRVYNNSDTRISNRASINVYTRELSEAQQARLFQKFNKWMGGELA